MIKLRIYCTANRRSQTQLISEMCCIVCISARLVGGEPPRQVRQTGVIFPSYVMALNGGGLISVLQRTPADSKVTVEKKQ